jgi:primary-amine oxidase
VSEALLAVFRRNNAHDAALLNHVQTLWYQSFVRETHTRCDCCCLQAVKYRSIQVTASKVFRKSHLGPSIKYSGGRMLGFATRATTFVGVGVLLATSGLALCAENPSAQTPTHPLDALTAPEIQEVVALLRAAGQADEQSIFSILTLREPSKPAVLGWHEGQRFERRADVVVTREAGVFEAVVDLAGDRVESMVRLAGVQPRFVNSEFSAMDAVKRDPQVAAGLQRRGFSAPFNGVICAPLAAGPMPQARASEGRVANFSCYDTSDQGGNPFGRPIEGLMAVVRLGENKVLRVIDLGVVPMTDDGGSLLHERSSRYRAESRPIVIVAPEGSNITLDGSQVRWDNWRFHLRADLREGLIASLIRFDDHGTLRDIAYQISPSEMFVPYMDPDPTWSWKAYMDIGEYGFGEYMSELKSGSDCPASGSLLSATLPSEKGEPVVRRNVICIFERPTGDPLWRHGADNSRANVELVVRTAPVVGNYDYLIDYVFDRAGNIDVRVGALGIDAAKGVASQNMSEPTAARDTAYGPLIGRGLVGVNHDHYVAFRIDLDVDGTDNRAVFDQIRPRKLAAGSDRRSLWQVGTRVIGRAGPLREPAAAGMLRIESSTRRNALGNPASYQIYPGHTEVSLLSEDDPIQKRAAWSRYPIWLSRHDAGQRHASGPFPNQNSRSEGLVEWTRGGQDLADRDLVLWYSVGFRHVPRAEDWPAMPAVWHGFRLRPFNFFDRSPAMDIPPERASVP